jgi:IS4 transposase
MSDGNKKRDWRVFETLYYKLVRHYEGVLRAKHKTSIIEEIKGKTIKIVDSTTISLCMSLFSWAKFRTAKGGLKIHTAWDDTLALPDLINITPAATHDAKGHPMRIYSKGTIIIEDKGYFDFRLMADRCAAGNYFVTRIKDNTTYEVLSERELPAGEDEHILKDEEIMLTGKKATEAGLEPYALRRVAVYDADKDRVIEVLTNNFEWKAATVGALYKKRWDIELFFKAMKQNCR